MIRAVSRKHKVGVSVEPQALPREVADHVVPAEPVPLRPGAVDYHESCAPAKTAPAAEPTRTPAAAAAAEERAAAFTELAGVAKFGLGLGLSAYGLRQVREGLDEVEAGRTGAGTIKTIEGAANAFGGAALAAGAPPNVSATAFGIAAGADGTRDLIDAVEEGSYDKLALGTVKIAGSAAMISQNPIAQGIGTAISIGAAAYEHREQLAEAAEWIEEVFD